MKRSHEMPFGAECREDGFVRFRLWAPAAQRVDLRLETANGPSQIALNRQDDGGHELTTREAKAGTHYSFVIAYVTERSRLTIKAYCFHRIRRRPAGRRLTSTFLRVRTVISG